MNDISFVKRATVEEHAGTTHHLPDINVTLANNETDFIIRYVSHTNDYINTT